MDRFQNVEADVAKAARTVMLDRGDAVYFACRVGKMNRHKQLDRRMLLFSEVGLELYYVEGDHSKLVRTRRRFTWFEIKTISSQPQSGSPSSLLICSAEEKLTVVFESELSYDTAVDVLVRCLRRVLTVAEFPQITVAGRAVLGSAVHPTRPLARFRARLLERGRAVPVAACDVLRATLLSHGRDFDMTSLQSAFIPELLEAMVEVDVRLLALGQADESHWPALARFVLAHDRVEVLSVGWVPDESLLEFGRLLTGRLPKSLRRIVFTSRPAWPAGAVRFIGQLYRMLPIPGIVVPGLEAALATALVDELQPCGSLVEFQVEEAHDVTALLDKLPRLEVLGLKNCRVDCFAFLASLPACARVRELDLTGCVLVRPAEVRLPASIEKLVVNGVTGVARLGLEMLVASCLAAPSLTDFSCCNGSMATVVVDRAFARPAEREWPRVRRLAWDGNVVTPVLVRFLERLVGLRSLSLGGTVATLDAAPWRVFCDYLARARVLEVLSLVGSVSGCLRADLLVALMGAVAENTSLKSLDVSRNPFDEAVVRAILAMLERNDALNELHVGACFGLDFVLFEEFLKKLEYTDRALRIALIRTDFEVMCTHMTDDQVDGYWSRMDALAARPARVRRPVPPASSGVMPPPAAAGTIVAVPAVASGPGVAAPAGAGGGPAAPPPSGARVQGSGSQSTPSWNRIRPALDAPVALPRAIGTPGAAASPPARSSLQPKVSPMPVPIAAPLAPVAGAQAPVGPSAAAQVPQFVVPPPLAPAAWGPALPWGEGEEWRVTGLPPVGPPDDRELLAAFAAEFSMDSILDALRRPA